MVGSFSNDTKGYEHTCYRGCFDFANIDIMKLLFKFYFWQPHKYIEKMCAYGFHVTSPKGINYDYYLDN